MATCWRQWSHEDDVLLVRIFQLIRAGLASKQLLTLARQVQARLSQKSRVHAEEVAE
jgi:hypothetical protein